MSTLLRVDSSPILQSSVSRQLTEEFVQKWKARHPDGSVISRDLNQTHLAPVTGEWIAAAHTPEEQRSSEQKQALELSDTLIAELQGADEYAIGLPMHNFSVPSMAKLWIDLVARPGKTFIYADGRAKGLLAHKKATFIIASGGTYGAGTAYASFNFVEPYVRAFFAFLGVTDAASINVGGTTVLNYGQVNREAFLQPYIEAVAAQISAS